MKSIVWLASYPKSGNTWLRAFLANYVRNSDTPCPINKIHMLGIGDSNAQLYNRVATGRYDVNNAEHTVQLRKAVLQGIVNNRADVNFVKTHCENGTAFGVKLIPNEVTRSAIYIMRNPLDMVSSYADHFGCTIDHAIRALGHKDAILPGDEGSVCQFMGAWSNHVVGWANARKFPVLVLRYEDMLKYPYVAFDKVVRHIGLPLDGKRLEKSIKFSDFKTLKKQEEKTTYVEKSTQNKKFFRRGKSDQWKDDLTDEQVSKILQDHGRVMKKYGYEV